LEHMIVRETDILTW